MRKILVVDDTQNVRVMLSDFLASQDYDVLLAGNGSEAMSAVRVSDPDLILLDIMMPNMDGYQFIKQLRQVSSLPVIMITARQQEEDIIKGFELGADDYITKPFKMRELLMRIRAVMRRSAPDMDDAPCLVIGDISIDRGKHEVRKGDQLVDLTPLEFLILELLMRSCGQVIRRQDMAIRLMDHSFAGSEATLKIHIRNIRMKLGEDIDQPRYIETVFGIGYRFVGATE